MCRRQGRIHNLGFSTTEKTRTKRQKKFKNGSGTLSSAEHEKCMMTLIHLASEPQNHGWGFNLGIETTQSPAPRCRLVFVLHFPWRPFVSQRVDFPVFMAKRGTQPQTASNSCDW